MADYNEIYALPYDFTPIKKVTFKTATGENYSVSEAYKILKTNIMFSSENIHSIVVTSANGEEGKSTVATELAKSFADSQKRTLLIDADMRGSVMLSDSARQLNILGLAELLSGLAELTDVIYGTQDGYYDVIFTGHFPPNPVELLSSDRLGAILKALGKVYDYIIIDTPPLMPVIDAAIVSSVVDGTVLVVSQNKTGRKDAQTVKAQLERSKAKILGVVLNKTEPDKLKKREYAYGYGRHKK